MITMSLPVMMMMVIPVMNAHLEAMTAPMMVLIMNQMVSAMQVTRMMITMVVMTMLMMIR